MLVFFNPVMLNNTVRSFINVFEILYLFLGDSIRSNNGQVHNKLEKINHLDENNAIYKTKQENINILQVILQYILFEC